MRRRLPTCGPTASRRATTPTAATPRRRLPRGGSSRPCRRGGTGGRQAPSGSTTSAWSLRAASLGATAPARRRCRGWTCGTGCRAPATRPSTTRGGTACPTRRGRGTTLAPSLPTGSCGWRAAATRAGRAFSTPSFWKSTCTPLRRAAGARSGWRGTSPPRARRRPRRSLTGGGGCCSPAGRAMETPTM
ncbi:hypothetical protein BU14_3181s0001 [Porphyra umbilicalis]|uniref:Uncharacterized protein n=1 Tax=Porphyra umbilicalis TaxID=2786 RepID=A0A1X6NI75_PORUM|nr:hypothetical protein BU14_3181s0001 [Porphyra umbilicalis]|eukprot:OSX68230.1 hypothetical protein BU14_3181s0001 [Porphyra umbilicalis]